MPKTIAVIDGNSLMHRAYHAVPPTMNAPDGTPTNAVFGFMSMLLKFVDDAHPDAIVCAFDAGRPKCRTEALAQYKAQRPPMDNELCVQFPLIEDLLTAMAIPIIKIEGWEGDDILGTISARGDADDFDTLLITGDKDAYQLVSEHTRVVTTKKGITDVAIYAPADVEERYGVTPAQFPDFLGLMGDSSDNIPGVPGIGAKTAAKLLQQFKTMEGIYENLDKLKGKQLENLRDNRDAAFLSRQVATIICNLDFELDLDAVSFPAFEEQAVVDAFGKLRFNAHLSKVLSLVGGTATREQIELEWADYATGSAAAKFAQAAIERASAAASISSNACIGVSFDDPQQESLFESGLKVALSTDQGCALLEGDGAVDILTRIVRSCPFAVFDAKTCMQKVYPADTGCAAAVSDADVLVSRAFDASLAAYVLNSSVSAYTPAGLAGMYLDGALPQGKNPADALVIQAACMRVLVDPLRKALESDGTAQVYDTIDMPLVAVLACMERVGAPIDIDRLRQMGERTQVELDSLVGRIYESAGEEFNVDSPKQVSRILFEVLGLKPRKKTSRGYSTDAKVLKELSEDHELPGLILKYRELAKIKGTYIDALPKMRGLDGRLHTSFNETVTTTGRLSSSDPNLQNIPVRTDFGRGIRECFVPFAADEMFVSADYSQIELRLLAHLSGDEHLIAAFASGADFHAATAARVFGIPVEEVTPQLRSRAKAVNFGIVYGQQAYGLGQSLHIGYTEAQEMIDRYFEAYPGVRTYLDKTVEQAKSDGFAVTMFGRKRHIPELRSANGQQRAFGERTAMNHPMQGSAADIIKKAMVEAERRLRVEFPKAKLMLQVHDELDLSVPEDQVAGVSSLLSEVMQNVVELKVPLLVDVSSGSNWAEAH